MAILDIMQDGERWTDKAIERRIKEYAVPIPENCDALTRTNLKREAEHWLGSIFWARRELADRAMITRIGIGMYQITEAGRARLRSGIPDSDGDTQQQQPEPPSGDQEAS